MTTPEPARSSLGIHRMLDDAFAGLELTPDLQDLKEEIRANLVARAEELERSGAPAAEAATRAMTELGDIRAAIGEEPAGPAAPTSAGGGQFEDWARNRVRPRPQFVLRTVLLSAVAFLALLLLVLGLLGVIELPLAGTLLAVVALAVSLGVVTADALRQETTTNYPLP
jgi:hypothetical protein